VAREERGEFGHGYDPVFIPDGFEITAAQMPPEVKNSLSHRAMALQQLIAALSSGL
jgi:XTP/dITP diphosphohydrolase